MEIENTDVFLGEEQEELEIQKPIGVYVKVNEDGFITDINSEIFIDNFEGWTKYDEGYGDKYAHAQNMYFEKPLVEENNIFNYKYEK